MYLKCYLMLHFYTTCWFWTKLIASVKASEQPITHSIQGGKKSPVWETAQRLIPSWADFNCDVNSCSNDSFGMSTLKLNDGEMAKSFSRLGITERLVSLPSHIQLFVTPRM